MSGRYYLWIMARLVAAVLIVAWAASYIGSGNGEKEFQKTQEAIKHVRSFRMTDATQSSPAQRVESLWEVDCNKNNVHYRWHVSSGDGDPAKEVLQDRTSVAGQDYDRNTDGTFALARYTDANHSAKIVCDRIAQGTSLIFPQLDNMIRRGVIQKADKKTVNGVRCREWHVTLRAGLNRLAHDSVCIGLEDHLPYELTDAATGTHTSFSDYNVPLQIELPDLRLQPASAGTN